MGIFRKKHRGGFADVIRCDEKDYLIWKWHPDKYEEGELKRETAIRTNSVLRVRNGEVAVFVYNKKDGENEDYIVGPHDETLKTKNFPVLSSIIGLWYEGDTPFQAEVFFINLAKVIQIKFGIPYFDVVDPRFADFTVPVAVRGTLTFKIDDYKSFVKFHKLTSFDIDSFRKQVNDTVCHLVKDSLIRIPLEDNIPVVSLETRIGLLNNKAEITVKERLEEIYGVEVTSLDVASIEIDKESEGYRELKKITKDITARQKEAEIHDYEEKLRIQREEGQYAQHMGTKTANIGAYQTEVKGEVGVASAEALGKMGENGAGNVDLGGHGAGFNPMTIMAGMAVGSVVGRNLAANLDGSLSGANGTVPPPLPTAVYYVAINDVANGPFDLNQIKEMISNGHIKKETLIWKSGTPTWEYISSLKEFNKLFPPDLPKK